MAERKPNDERETLQQLAEGSESAFVYLFDKYSPRVYTTALKFLHTEEAAQEVVQDVFLDIWLRRYKMGEVLNFAGYLQGMVRNQVYDAYRSKSALADLVTELSRREQAENQTERLYLEKEYEEILSDAVGALPPLQQQIFRMAKEEGLSHQEIAEKLNLTHLAVKAHMKRILKIIRTRLQPFLASEALFLALFYLMDFSL